MNHSEKQNVEAERGSRCMMCALLFPVGDTYVGSAVENVPEELICPRVAAMIISYVILEQKGAGVRT